MEVMHIVLHSLRSSFLYLLAALRMWICDKDLVKVDSEPFRSQISSIMGRTLNTGVTFLDLPEVSLNKNKKNV